MQLRAIASWLAIAAGLAAVVPATAQTPYPARPATLVAAQAAARFAALPQADLAKSGRIVESSGAGVD